MKNVTLVIRPVRGANYNEARFTILISQDEGCRAYNDNKVCSCLATNLCAEY